MKQTEKHMQLCVTLLTLNLIFIWGNSLLPGSVSQAFSDWIGELLKGLHAAPEETQPGRGLLRKIAHVTEFCALGVWLAWLMKMMKKQTLWAFAAGVGAACVDELLQCFVPDRGPGLLDVGIDSTGVALGILLQTAVYTINKNYNYGGKK